MASIEIPLISEHVEPEPDLGGVQRNTTGNLNSPNSGIKIVSRYLRSSPGSCHDFCKYGHKHATEAKERSLMRKSAMAKRGNGKDRVTIVSSEKMMPAISPKPSMDSTTQKSDDPMVSKTEVSSSMKEATVSSEEDLSAVEGLDASGEDSIDQNMKVQDNPAVGEKDVSSFTNEATASSKEDLSTLEGMDVSVDQNLRTPDSSTVSKLQVSSSIKEATVSAKEDLSALEGIDVLVEDSVDPNVRPPLPGKGCSANQRNSSTKKGKESPKGSSSRGTSRNKGKEMRISGSGERKALFPPTVSLSAKQSSRRASGISARNFEKTKGGSHLKSQNNIKNAETEHTSNKDVPEKTLYIIESTVKSKTLEPTSNLSVSSSSSSDDKNMKHARKGTGTNSSPLSSEKKLRPMRSGVHASRPTASHSPGRKGLRRTQYETRSTQSLMSSLQSSSSSISPSELHDSKENDITSRNARKETKNQMIELKVEKGKKEANNQIVPVKVEKRSSSSRRGVVVSENRNLPAQKLKFRRGTVVDLKPENNAPRRLKFRRARLLGEIQKGKGDVEKESIRKSEADDNEFGTKKEPEKVVIRHQNVEGTTRRSTRKKEIYVGERSDTKTSLQNQSKKSNPEKVVSRYQLGEGTTRRASLRRKETNEGKLVGTKTNSEKVVLRHQKVEGKKEVQSLFNNVIEETASKLVETRKSKVKALVGAFETVISLQDNKPPAMAASSSS
ncbi:hypothetical protein UlMin_008345 [Ulmus minor]